VSTERLWEGPAWLCDLPDRAAITTILERQEPGKLTRAAAPDRPLRSASMDFSVAGAIDRTVRAFGLGATCDFIFLIVRQQAWTTLLCIIPPPGVLPAAPERFCPCGREEAEMAVATERAKPRRRLPPEILTDPEVLAVMHACGDTDTGVRNQALIVVMYRSGPARGRGPGALPPSTWTGGGTVRVLCGKGGRSHTVGLTLGVWRSWPGGWRSGRLWGSPTGAPLMHQGRQGHGTGTCGGCSPTSRPRLA